MLIQWVKDVDYCLTLQKKVSNRCFETENPSSIMLKKEDKNSIVEICPVRNVVARFGNKWAFLVILILSEKSVVRFNELCRQIPDVSSRVLSSTLRGLEADGLISRKVYPVVPPKVEYRLTDIGSSLVPLIKQVTDWAQANMKTIVSHRKRYEEEFAVE